MAVKVLSVRRMNPAPCQHFKVVVDVDGREVSFITEPSDIRGNDESSIAEETLKRLRQQGPIDMESLPGKVLVEDSPRAEAVEVSIRPLVSAPRVTLWSRVKGLIWRL